MENARDNKDSLDSADAPVPTDTDDFATPSEKPASAHPKRPHAEKPSDEERCKMHASLNGRISYLCKMAALIIALISLATLALGQAVPQLVIMGLCLSVALLAISSLQDYHQRKR